MHTRTEFNIRSQSACASLELFVLGTTNSDGWVQRLEGAFTLMKVVGANKAPNLLHNSLCEKLGSVSPYNKSYAELTAPAKFRKISHLIAEENYQARMFKVTLTL